MKAPRFSDTPITLTLTGGEWFSVMIQLAREPLSEQGSKLFKTAVISLAYQIADAADDYDTAKKLAYKILGEEMP